MEGDDGRLNRQVKNSASIVLGYVHNENHRVTSLSQSARGLQVARCRHRCEAAIRNEREIGRFSTPLLAETTVRYSRPISSLVIIASAKSRIGRCRRRLWSRSPRQAFLL